MLLFDRSLMDHIHSDAKAQQLGILCTYFWHVPISSSVGEPTYFNGQH